VLVNNAGVFEPFFVETATDAQIRTAIDTNLAGQIWCARAAIPLLPRGGHIINVSSETVVMPVAMLALYQSAKAGLERLSRTLSQELEPAGIWVTLFRAGKMFEPDMEWHQDPETARLFHEANLRIGVDNRNAALSRYASAAGLIPWLIDLPADVNIPELMIEGPRP
jgi:meso-butanediol dehydrogenase/(S,S)-butanediol dehydrogenase/diacetyl reductase